MIAELDFAAYFLITWDIVRYAVSAGYHHVGWGSGANSIVAYCLFITDVEPLELDLYFERFINPQRSLPPDFDIDFSWDERDDVTDYIFNRAVLHLDLDAFFVAVEQLHNDRLRGKPLLIGGNSNRGVVASCSYEARAFGVRSAMPMKQALQLCPDAIVLKGDMENYARHSVLVREVIADQAPLFEQASIDEFYLDLTGMDKYIGCWKWSRELRERIIRETGLPISVGLSANKTVSKVGAGEAKPNGEQLVLAGTEKAFLGPLAVGKLPMVGRETARRLAFMGVRINFVI